ncbi:hypothetical protein ScPMuIL_010958 [Solemya velum]
MAHPRKTNKANSATSGITSGKELQDHTGDVAKETVVLTLVDVKGDEITQPAVQIGKLVRLRATIVGESSSAGIMAASCEAIGSTGSTSYRFIKGGCGDGYVIPKSDGFYSHGRSALSPVIQFFQIKGSDVIQFVCNFSMCQDNCDGNNCAQHIRMFGKRHARDIFRTLIGESMPIKTARVDIQGRNRRNVLEDISSDELNKVDIPSGSVSEISGDEFNIIQTLLRERSHQPENYVETKDLQTNISDNPTTITEEVERVPGMEQPIEIEVSTDTNVIPPVNKVNAVSDNEQPDETEVPSVLEAIIDLIGFEHPLEAEIPSQVKEHLNETELTLLNDEVVVSETPLPVETDNPSPIVEVQSETGVPSVVKEAVPEKDQLLETVRVLEIQQPIETDVDDLIDDIADDKEDTMGNCGGEEVPASVTYRLITHAFEDPDDLTPETYIDHEEAAQYLINTEPSIQELPPTTELVNLNEPKILNQDEPDFFIIENEDQKPEVLKNAVGENSETAVQRRFVLSIIAVGFIIFGVFLILVATITIKIRRRVEIPI